MFLFSIEKNTEIDRYKHTHQLRLCIDHVRIVKPLNTNHGLVFVIKCCKNENAIVPVSSKQIRRNKVSNFSNKFSNIHSNFNAWICVILWFFFSVTTTIMHMYDRVPYHIYFDLIAKKDVEWRSNIHRLPSTTFQKSATYSGSQSAGSQKVNISCSS